MTDTKKMLKASLILVAASLLAACATYDDQDRFVFGEATRHNIAEQSVRDVNLPNSRKVEDSSGVRAASAVKALNEGAGRQTASTGAAAGASQ